MRAIQLLRKSISEDILNYTQVMEAFRDYKKPRDVINTLLKNNDLIRVKKGLYVFGEPWRKKPVSVESLANLIYGPSVISTEYVLSKIGLIPEHVTTITSITSGRSRNFDTPFGKFTYKQIKKELVSFGAEINQSGQEKYFIASPIKALADKVWLDKRFKPTSPRSYEEYLFDDLRIDRDILGNYLEIDFLNDLVKAYEARKITWFIQYLKKEFKINE